MITLTLETSEAVQLRNLVQDAQFACEGGRAQMENTLEKGNKLGWQNTDKMEQTIGRFTTRAAMWGDVAQALEDAINQE